MHPLCMQHRLTLSFAMVNVPLCTVPCCHGHQRALFRPRVGGHNHQRSPFRSSLASDRSRAEMSPRGGLLPLQRPPHWPPVLVRCVLAAFSHMHYMQTDALPGSCR
jgi:hypothetical protein